MSATAAHACPVPSAHLASTRHARPGHASLTQGPLARGARTQSFILGAIATMIASSATFPAARARAILQTQRLSSGDTSTRKLRAMCVLREIMAREGLLGLYKGLGPQLAKGVLSSALTLATKEKLQRYTSILVRVAILMVQLFLTNSQQHVLRLTQAKRRNL